MKIKRIKNKKDPQFKQAWELYEEAFPPEERKSLNEQVNMFANNDYHFDIYLDNDQFVGFILWWDFEDYRFIDHFAISKKERNKGRGELILNNFMLSAIKPIILEVELPTSSIKKRRIKFYERIGFYLNQHHYVIPPLVVGEKPLQLMIMSYPKSISQENVNLIMEKYHPIIY